MLDVRHLGTLRACADAGSFAGAAKKLSYTTSAVSQQIAALEREAGAVLVERLARGVRLTEAGSALLVHADIVLAELADAAAELDGLAGRRGGHLRFGAFPTAMSCLGPVVIETFRSRYPAIEPLFVDVEPYEALLALRSRELDLALVFWFDRWGAGKGYDGVERCSGEVVNYIDLFDDEFFVLLPRTHELANRRVVRIEQLRDERILGSGQPWAPDFRHLCASAAFDPRLDESYRGTDFPAIQALVAAGNFVSLIPGLALSLLRDDVVVRPLDRPLVRHVAAATPRSAYRPPAAEAMIEVLREVAPLTARATATARTHAV